MYSCSTSTYKLHCYETATGFRFVLLTDLASGEMRDALRHIYSELFVECIVKNPVCSLDECISAPSFLSGLDEYILSLSP